MDKGGEMKDEIKNLRYELLHVTAERDELQKENEGLKAKEIRGDRMISDLEHQNTVLQKENEGWDQQAQEVERLREEVANSKYPLHRQGLYNYIYGVTKGTVHEHSPHTQDIMRALQSPSSAKDTPDNYVASKQNGKPGHCFCAQVFGPDGKSILMIEPTKNQEVATKLAKDIAKFLNGRNALKR
jgi:hypothetical protein